MEPHCRCFQCYDYFPCPIHRPGEEYVSIDKKIAALQRPGKIVRVAKSKRIIPKGE